MSEETNIYSARAAELRDAFDRMFASPLGAATDELESVLALSVAGDRFAVRLLEINGMAKSARIVPVPNRTRALLGLAGIRGELLPVYSLSELLGYNGNAEVRWLLLCGESPRIGLGVSDFHGCAKVSKSACSAAEGQAGRSMSREVVAIQSAAHTVIDIASLLKSIRDPKKEGE